jgi:hypothetical protein
MSSLAAIALLVIAAGLALLIYARRAPSRQIDEPRTREGPPVQATTAWTSAAGDEFAGLSESARCDMIFAVAALDDERSQQLLEHALEDPAEAVSLAAAHALAGHGRRDAVDAYLARHPGARADRIAQALAVLD